ncbi:MAG: hypothetical protein ABI634_02685 [Acidobacteriota bacterium]
MALSVVQRADDGQPDDSRSTIVLTFGGAPTPGNVMVAIISTGDFPSPGTMTPPSGWTTVDDLNQDFVGLHVYRRVVQSGDGASYTWTYDVTDNHHGVLWEVTEADVAAPINAFGKAVSGSSLTLAPSATPTVDGCLALSVYSNDSGGISGVSAGWTLDVNQDVSHPADAASRNALTSGLSAVSVTWTQNFGNACGAYIVLIEPAAAAAGGAPPMRAINPGLLSLLTR